MFPISSCSLMHQLWFLKLTRLLSSMKTFHWVSPASFWLDPTNLFQALSHVCFGCIYTPFHQSFSYTDLTFSVKTKLLLNLSKSSIFLDGFPPAGGYISLIIYNNKTKQFLCFIAITPLHLEQRLSFDLYDIICWQSPLQWVHVRSVFTSSKPTPKVNSPHAIRPQHAAWHADTDLD